MRFTNHWSYCLRASQILLRAWTVRPDSRMVPARHATEKGTLYKLYEPIRSTRGTHILLYGMVYAGEAEPRLVNLADGCVRAGLRVVIPVLPGLKSFTLDTGDLERFIDLIQTLYKMYGPPIRITAFSFGAGLALVAAVHPQVSDLVEKILLFGPYYSLSQLWSELQQIEPPPEQTRLGKLPLVPICKSIPEY